MHNNPPIFSTRKIDLFVPEREELASVLQNGLRYHFVEATVEWVDCPDLTQEPFNLATSGLCGNAVIFEMSGMSYLFPSPKSDFMYNIKRIIKEIYNISNNGLIIGASIGLRLRQQQFIQLGDLIMNASFSRVTENDIEIINKSRLAFLDETTGRCALESIINSDPHCYPHGNFFISEGKPGQVLKVRAKKRIGLQFLTALQYSLEKKYSSGIYPKLIGLGGTFVMKSGIARHHVLPYQWSNTLTNARSIRNWLRYFDLKAPLVAIGTLLSGVESYEDACELSGLDVYGLTDIHFHAFSSNGSAGGHFYTDLESMDPVEYLGYFYPARIFNHVDPRPSCGELINFNDIMPRRSSHNFN
ncbi:ester hydrolase C11orf54-like [Cataglyphis hispanica]|uniref:ester hydrolase C11orf54-like n=1 Tax=Cataglyphis hispanica TaxID=1086592 RepID=UPI00217F842E|nr:ester hydrolase C11orf54-like [Cataglyphis hispanica]